MDKDGLFPFDKDILLKRGFDKEQIKELKLGIDSKVEVSVYFDTRFIGMQMRQIRLGLQDNLPVAVYTNAMYDWLQMEEIRKGLKRNLNVRKYASPQIPFDKMREIRKGLEEKIDLTEYIQYSAEMMREIRKSMEVNMDIIPYIIDGYDTSQLSYIRESFVKKVNIKPYLSMEFRGIALREIMLGIEDGLDVSIYAKKEYNWQQMRELRLGIKNRVDVNQYLSTFYNWQQMRELRYGLEMGIDISDYKSYMYTAKEMKKRREKIIGENDGIDSYNTIMRKGNDLEVKIDQNEMLAIAKIVNDSKNYTQKIIIDELAEYGIVEGLDYNAIDRMIRHKGNDEFIEIARGTEVENGSDGWYEFFFNTDNTMQPKILPDGSVDYQNTDWYQSVAKGNKVAYYHEAQEGHNGITVRGRIITARKGKEAGVLFYEGCELLEDKKTYIALKTGKVELKGNKVIISDTFEIDNVTLSTGNVDFDGNLYIKGNVLSGTTVKATGDIIVCGFVEAATIIAGGNIEIRLGVNASDKGYIEANNSVISKYFENATIRAGEDIRASYILNSDVSALGKINIDGAKGTIMGGVTYARLGINSNNIGNPMKMKTKVSIGVNDEMLDKLQIIVRNIRDVKKEIAALTKTLEEINEKNIPDEENLKEIIMKIKKSLLVYRGKLKKYQTEKEALEKEIDLAHKSKIVVKGNIYEGTIVDIEHSFWEATDLKNICIEKKFKDIDIIGVKI